MRPTLVRARLRLTLAVHPGQGLRNLAEQGLDVVARLGRRLDKHDVELFRLLLGFFGRHLPVRTKFHASHYQSPVGFLHSTREKESGKSFG